jgi:RND family efflux transporter MFP subunit
LKSNGIIPALLAIAWLASGMLVVSSCEDTSQAGAANQPAPQQRIAVDVARVTEETLTRKVTGQGALFAREQATLSAEVSGTVTEIAADFGDSVKAGQILLRIDPSEYRLRVASAEAALEQVRARLNNSEANFARAEELRRQNAISQAEFDRLAAALHVDEADLQAAEKALELAKKKLADTAVRAPFAGFVGRRKVALGEYVTPGRELYELIATDPVKVRTPVPEWLVPYGRVGMEITITVDSRPGEVFKGNVTRIAPAIEETTRTMLVEAEVPNPEGALKPGAFAHVTANLGEAQALFVPRASVMRYAGVARVFVIENGVARAREVTTGDSLGELIEVSKGLKLGELVAVSEVDRLADGVAVDARERAGGQKS